MRIQSTPAVRFKSQSPSSPAPIKAQVAQALRTSQVPHIKSLQAFDPGTIVVWTEPDKYGDVLDAVNKLGKVFTPCPPSGTINEFEFQANGKKVTVAFAPEGDYFPYFDYGLPLEKNPDPYVP